MTMRIQRYESFLNDACINQLRSDRLELKKTPQGYARKRTLKPGGSFFGSAS